MSQCRRPLKPWLWRVIEIWSMNWWRMHQKFDLRIRCRWSIFAHHSHPSDNVVTFQYHIKYKKGEGGICSVGSGQHDCRCDSPIGLLAGHVKPSVVGFPFFIQSCNTWATYSRQLFSLNICWLLCQLSHHSLPFTVRYEWWKSSRLLAFQPNCSHRGIVLLKQPIFRAIHANSVECCSLSFGPKAIDQKFCSPRICQCQSTTIRLILVRIAIYLLEQNTRCSYCCVRRRLQCYVSIECKTERNCQ